jgi:hypothetical protein
MEDFKYNTIIWDYWKEEQDLFIIYEKEDNLFLKITRDEC